MSVTEAALLREVALMQHQKTLLAVRDVVDSLRVTEPNGSYSTKPVTAEAFRERLKVALREMQERES